MKNKRSVVVSKKAHDDFYTLEYRKGDKTVFTISYDEVLTHNIYGWLSGASADSLKKERPSNESS